jgi:hypothetical protein
MFAVQTNTSGGHMRPAGRRPHVWDPWSKVSMLSHYWTISPELKFVTWFESIECDVGQWVLTFTVRRINFHFFYLCSSDNEDNVTWTWERNLIHDIIYISKKCWEPLIQWFLADYLNQLNLLLLLLLLFPFDILLSMVIVVQLNLCKSLHPSHANRKSCWSP